MPRARTIWWATKVAAAGALGVFLVLGAREVPWRRLWRRASPDAPPPPEGLLPDARIVVHKSQRRLILYSGQTEVGRFPIALGFCPTGDKCREGDGRTPEGDYYVCAKNPQSRFHLSLGLSYPGKKDAARGLEQGVISQDQHDRILAAIERRGAPPWDTPLGGEIYIHGGGAGHDWTLGCIALDNAHVRFLYDTVPLRTRVTIAP